MIVSEALSFLSFVRRLSFQAGIPRWGDSLKLYRPNYGIVCVSVDLFSSRRMDLMFNRVRIGWFARTGCFTQINVRLSPLEQTSVSAQSWSLTAERFPFLRNYEERCRAED